MRWLAAVAGLCLLGWLGLLSPQGQEGLAHQYQRLSFQWVADRITEGARSPQEAVARIFEYVHTRVPAPPNDKPIADIEPVEILAARRGWCDQQANVLVQLVRTLPLDGRLVFLRNAEGWSPHSVAEVYLDGAWRVVDPLHGVLILNHEKKLATREELAREPGLFSHHPQIRNVKAIGSGMDYAARASWYQYPATVFNSWHGKRKTWFAKSPRMVQQGLVYVLQELYLATASSAQRSSPLQADLRRARHYVLVGRQKAAERLFRRTLRHGTDPSVREDAWFFLGRLYHTQGRFAEARDAFQAALGETGGRGGGWSCVIHASLGQVYESLNQPGLALQAYEDCGLACQEPLLGQRILALRGRS